MFISRYHAQGRTLTALRLAEEAYEEAKALQDHTSQARILQSFGDIHFDLWQYEEATRFFLESIKRLIKVVNRFPHSLLSQECKKR